jgi:hypothetical protein
MFLFAHLVAISDAIVLSFSTESIISQHTYGTYNMGRFEVALSSRVGLGVIQNGAVETDMPRVLSDWQI